MLATVDGMACEMFMVATTWPCKRRDTKGEAKRGGG